MKETAETSYEEAVQYILDIPKFTSKNTPEDTTAFLARLGNPDKAGKIVHVAGTNGKGSVCAYLSNVLRKAEKSVCTFTSPHLVDIRERFMVNGRMISKEEFLEAYQCIMKIIHEDSQGIKHPTFFEFLFLMAMVLFRNKGCEYWILETGLGGRLDATNSVAEKELAIITHMGLDHTEYLGNTIEKIAGEKAGIMKNAKKTLFWETSEIVTEVLEEYAKKYHIPYILVSNCDYEFLNFKNKSIDFSYHSLYYDNVRLHLHTIAVYQQQNVTLALRAAELLLGEEDLSEKILQSAVEDTYWAGRMEEVMPEVFVDGAHNEDGILAFLDTVSRDGFCGKRHLYFGVVADKAYEDMIRDIMESNLFDEVSLIQINSARALSSDKMKEVFAHYTDKDIRTFSSAREAVLEIKNRREKELRIYMAGSLYLVGEIKENI